MSLASDISRALRDGGDRLALENPDQSATWREVGASVAVLHEALDRAGLGPGAVIGVLGRNRIAPAQAYLALLAGGRCAAPINPFQPADRIADDARATGVAALLIEDADVDADLWEGVGAVLVMTDQGKVRLHRPALGAPPPALPGVALLATTSGTTGQPKRIPIAEATLVRSCQEVDGFHRGFGDLDLPGPEQPPVIQYSPLAHIAGALALTRAGQTGRGVVLLEKFDAHLWADAVRRHRLRTTGLPPAMMRMVLDAAIPPADLESLVSVWSGTAPVDPTVQKTFTDRYGVPVLGNYGATEFCGAVANWSLDDYRLFSTEKAGAVGRISPIVAEARVRGREDGEVLPLGETGVLELKVRRVGETWLKTTDLASLDADGFLFLHGRSDDAINRGGFKILPEVVAAALKRHPGVRDAAVVGLDDPKLGQAPAAAVEARDGQPEPTETELIAFVKAQLPAYNAPVAVRVVASLPRTAVMKVDRRAVRALFER